MSLQGAVALVWLGSLGAGARWLGSSTLWSSAGPALVAQGVLGVFLSAAAAAGYGFWRVDLWSAKATLRASILGLLPAKVLVEAVCLVACPGDWVCNAFETLLAIGADFFLLYLVATASAATKA
mmetsp:Transcript_89875/g.275153  ORF Transcript_89875/g.275153 Transcript_89875/m.275153 type:complete len:124 (-) Transcript_89875:287-658(-)